MYVLDDAAIETFRTDGYLLLPGFYDAGHQIEPIRRGIHRIIGLVADEHDVQLDRGDYSPAEFDAGYQTLKDLDRSLASIVYDAVKQLDSFVHLTASPRHSAVMRLLRDAGVVGVVGGGSGIRIDNPGETKYLSWWHQEYPAQGHSLDGVVFWSPLREVTPDLGPVEILPGSHRDGLLPVFRDDDGSGREGAYALRLVDEQEIVAGHTRVAPLCRPGDVLILDFLTVHRSGVNRSRRSRWTMQVRYFNFEDPIGRSLGWTKMRDPLEAGR